MKRGELSGDITSVKIFEDYDRKIVVLLLCTVFLFMAGVYSNQRRIWMGEDSEHHLAKEYWVAGEVVNKTRMSLNQILSVDSCFLKPYIHIQKKLFRLGSELLPQNDGEIHLWHAKWFVYPYTRKLSRPSGVGNKVYESRMVELLDDCWEILEGLIQKNIADQKIKDAAELIYPSIAHYYSIYQGHYTGKFSLSRTRIGKSEKHRKRNYQLLLWLDTLKSSWEELGKTDQILRNYPFVAMAYQVTVHDTLKRIVLFLPFERRFDCEHGMVQRLLKEYYKIMSPDPKINWVLNLKYTNQEQSIIAYSTTVYSAKGSAINYIMDDICGMELPIEKYHLLNNNVNSRYLDSLGIFHLFKDEIELITNREES